MILEYCYRIDEAKVTAASKEDVLSLALPAGREVPLIRDLLSALASGVARTLPEGQLDFS